MKAHPDATPDTATALAAPEHGTAAPASPSPARRRWRLWLLAMGVVMVHLWLLERWLSTTHLPPGLLSTTPVAAVHTAPLPVPAPSQTEVDINRPTAADNAPTAAATPAPAATLPTDHAVAESARPAGDEKYKQNSPSSLISKQQFAPTKVATASPPSAPSAAEQEPASAARHDTARDTAAGPLASPPPAVEGAALGLAASAKDPSPTAQDAPPTGAASAAPATPRQTEAALTQPHRLVLPPAVSLVLDVRATRKGLTLPATSTLSLQHDGAAYQARLEIRAALAGARVQTSRGTLTPGTGLVPTRFGDKTKSEQAAHFDRTVTPAAIRFSANTPDAPLPTGAQDRLSVLFQLAAMLAGEPRRYPSGSQINLYVAGARDAEVWSFAVGATEALDLPAGRQTAIHLQRLPSHPYDNRVEIWLAPNLHYLPVRVRWTQANGDVVDQQLASVTF